MLLFLDKEHCACNLVEDLKIYLNLQALVKKYNLLEIEEAEIEHEKRHLYLMSGLFYQMQHVNTNLSLAINDSSSIRRIHQ